MAADAKEHVPARLREEEAAAEAEFLAGGGENPDEAGATAEGAAPADVKPATDPAPDAQPPQGDTAKPADDGHPAPDTGKENGGDLATRLAAAEERARIAEQQYRTLLGKYNAEVPREQHRTADLQHEITALKSEIAALKTGKPADKTNAKPAAEREIPSATDPNNPYGLTTEQLEYGTDMIGLAEKIAKQIIDREVGDIRGKTETVSQELSQRRQEKFYGDLDGLAPDWRMLNADARFAEFCREFEPNSGLLWQDIIDAGQQRMDPVRVSNVFNAFRAAGGTKPAPKSAAVTPLDAQVTPTSAPSPAPDARKTYTMKEYNALMDNIIHGRYTNEKARKIEAELDAAINEGRVKG